MLATLIQTVASDDWLTALAIGLFAAVVAGGAAVTRRVSGNFWWPTALCVLSLIALCLIGGDRLPYLSAEELSGVDLAPWLVMLVAIAVVMVAMPHLHARWMRGRPHLSSAVLMVLVGVIAAWAVDQSAPPDNPEFTPGEEVVAPKPKLAREVVLVTDQGLRISAFVKPPSAACTSARDEEVRQLRQFENRVVASAAPSNKSNCHGWVFAGGQFSIQGTDVERILKDNGYTEVQRPAWGDLIVYRDPTDVIAHTGIVKGTGADGRVLVESKWGYLGRYIHEPQVQPYGNRFRFYRSDREGHLLLGAHAADGPTDPFLPGQSR